MLLAVLVVILLGAFWRFQSLQQWVINAVILNTTPTPNAVMLAMTGEQAYQAGDLSAALDYYRRAVELEPDRLDIAFEFGRMLIYEGYNGTQLPARADEAFELAKRLVERAPDDARAHTLMALALTEQRRYNEAVAAGLRAVDLAPDFAEAWAYLSMAYYWSGRPSNAEETAERAVELNPDSIDARRAMAMALTYRGNVDLVIDQLLEAQQRHPNLSIIYFELAVYYRAQGNFEASVQAYDRVLSSQPDNVKAYTRKCYTYYLMGEYALSAETCRQAVQLDPSYAAAYQNLGRAEYRNRDYDAAIQSLETCSRLEEEQGVPPEERSIDCVYVRGLALALSDRCPEAWPLLTASLQMLPNDMQREAIMAGMELCAAGNSNYDMGAVPTPVTPTAAP